MFDKFFKPMALNSRVQRMWIIRCPLRAIPEASASQSDGYSFLAGLLKVITIVTNCHQRIKRQEEKYGVNHAESSC